MAPTTSQYGTRLRSALCAALLGAAATVQAQNMQVTFSDPNSVKSAAASITYNMMTYYKGNQTGQTPGVLPGNGQSCDQCYYWWETGAMFGAVIDYWYFTGDSSYNDVTTQAIQFQRGDNNDFQPKNQTFDLGNDDQDFWGLTALYAAEENFPAPPSTDPSWLSLAQAVYNTQVPRWDGATCGGGLRWQFNQFNAGYTYKSTIANVGLMNIAARIGLYTGNTTYLDFANQLYTWVKSVNLIDGQYNVWDGVSVTDNCTTLDRLQWTYNAGMAISATATMYNATKLWNYNGAQAPSFWETEVQGILTKSNQVFFKNGVVWEIECEDQVGQAYCDSDQKTYKSYLIRWMSWACKIAPSVCPSVTPLLLSTSQAVASCCNCGSPGACGFKWTTPGTCDGSYGVGQQMGALQAMLSNLQVEVPGPINVKNGGTSASDPTAGSGASTLTVYGPVTTGEKAGAGILTTLVVVVILGGAVWLVL